MAKEDRLESLLTAGFADIKKDMKDLKSELMILRDDVQNVKETAAENSKKVEDQASEMTDIKEQVKTLIASDQDHRRRAGRR